jgi:hypothetical protein
MQNVTTKVSKDGKKLTIEIDLTKEFGLSASGKTISIGSTKGNKTIEGTNGVVLGLNVYKYPSK